MVDVPNLDLGTAASIATVVVPYVSGVAAFLILLNKLESLETGQKSLIEGLNKVEEVNKAEAENNPNRHYDILKAISKLHSDVGEICRER